MSRHIHNYGIMLLARWNIFKLGGDNNINETGGVIYLIHWYRIKISTARPRDRWPQGIWALQMYSFLWGPKKFQDTRILSLGLAITHLKNFEGFTWALCRFCPDL